MRLFLILYALCFGSEVFAESDGQIDIGRAADASAPAVVPTSPSARSSAEPVTTAADVPPVSPPPPSAPPLSATASSPAAALSELAAATGCVITRNGIAVLVNPVTTNTSNGCRRVCFEQSRPSGSMRGTSEMSCSFNGEAIQFGAEPPATGAVSQANSNNPLRMGCVFRSEGNVSTHSSAIDSGPECQAFCLEKMRNYGRGFCYLNRQQIAGPSGAGLANLCEVRKKRRTADSETSFSSVRPSASAETCREFCDRERGVCEIAVTGCVYMSAVGAPESIFSDRRAAYRENCQSSNAGGASLLNMERAR